MVALVRDVKAAAKARTDIYYAHISLRRSGRFATGLCPFHQDKTPSFAVYEDGRWRCYAGCGEGDTIDFIMRLRGLSYVEAVKQLSGDIVAYPPYRYDDGRGRAEFTPTARPQPYTNKALSLWEGATAPGIAKTYLRSRGLDPTLPEALRGHGGVLYAQEAGTDKPALDEPWKTWWSPHTRTWWQGIEKPATVAAITDPHGKITAAHCIWCDPVWELENGIAAPKGTRAILKVSKKTYGSMGAGAVRLSEPGPILGLSEGLESALSAAEMFSLPVWATCGASRLGSIQLPECVEQVIIYGDAGKSGEAAAAKAARAYRRRGYQVGVDIPESYGDWNEVLMALVFG